HGRRADARRRHGHGAGPRLARAGARLDRAGARAPARPARVRLASAASRLTGATLATVGPMRLAVALLVALPLAAADLAVKATWPTPWWAYHQRSLAWVLLCLIVLAAISLLLRLPSLLVPPAAGILAGGVL